jgi:hypothetical protein
MFSLWNSIKELIRFQSLPLHVSKCPQQEALPPCFPHGASVKREILHFKPFLDMEY